MVNNESPQSASEILNKINEFVEPSEDELLQMPLEEVRKDLLCAGIDVDKDIKVIKSEIKNIEAKNRLTQAREKRLRLADNLKQFVASVQNLDKQELLSAIKKEFGFSEKQAMVYCRKFEECNTEDLQTLLEDLEFLKDDEHIN